MGARKNIFPLGSSHCSDMLPVDHSSVDFLGCHHVDMTTETIELGSSIPVSPGVKAQIGTCAHILTATLTRLHRELIYKAQEHFSIERAMCRWVLGLFTFRLGLG